MSNLEVKDAPAEQEPAAEFKSLVNVIEGKLGEIGKAVSGLSDRLARLEAKSARPGAATAETKSASDAVKVWERFLRYGPDSLDIVERKSLRLANDEQGGYLAIPEFVAEIDKNITQFSPVRQYATVRNTSAASVETLRRTSPATAFWVSEGEDRTETSISWGKNSYPVAELGTYVDVSNQLPEDASVDVAAEVVLEFAEAFDVTEASAFMVGDGVKKPLGILSDTSIGYTPSGNASAISADSLLDLFHTVKAPYRANGTWFMNSNTLSAVRKLKTGNGEYLLSMTGLAGAPVTTLLGRPVAEAPEMDDIGAGKFPILFGDLRLGFSIYDRIALSILRDPFTQATKGRTRFHGRRRVAGGVRRAEAIRKLKVGTN